MVLPKTFKNNYRKTDDDIYNDIYNDNDNDKYEENIFGFLNNILEPFTNMCTVRPR